jgi:hypothetical protein
MNFIGQASVKLGMHASVDEQKIVFEGRHADKLRIMYKAEGDGFQADCICENGMASLILSKSTNKSCNNYLPVMYYRLTEKARFIPNLNSCFPHR